MLIARTGNQMVSLVLVIFALQRYGSAEIAGAVTFLSIFPGLLCSPLGGALLDRHGRTRLVVLDYFIAAVALALIATLGQLDLLPVPLLLVIVTITSLTGPLSATGVRTLFPLIVPAPLWERANAIDSNGYVVASIFGPAAAGALVAAFGAPAALGGIALLYAVAAFTALGLRDPSTRADTGRILGDAWRGLVYVARNPTLRALAAAVSISNIGWGMFFLALPVLVLRDFGGGPEQVGVLFAINGVAGFVSVLVVGRSSTRGIERHLLAAPALAYGLVFMTVMLFPQPLVVAAAMVVFGIATGPFDVVMFTLRQRRTDPAWIGRAFAVSMALNFAGFPIGSALAGALVPISIGATLAIATATEVLAAVIAWLAIPQEDPLA
jgi:predicted MFS family arabinose efflux permease